MPIAPNTRFGCFQTESFTFSPMRCSADSILGIFDRQRPMAKMNNATAKKYTYSLTTAFASCEALGAIAEDVVPRMTRAPTQGNTAVPSELKACVRFRRLDAVCDFPST